MAKRLPFKEFKEIYSKVPRLCVDLVIKNKDDILLTKRSIPPAKGFWHLPGGTVLYKESLDMAVKRVAKEELGVKVRIIKLLGAVEFLDNRTTLMGHSISLPYLIRVKSGQLKLNSEASEFGFFKKLPPKTIPEHSEFLKRLYK